MTGDPPQLSGEQLAAVSRAMGQLKAELYGKGPVESRSFLNHNMLFCVMTGGLTTVEETLLEANDEPLVRQVRLRFQEQLRPRFLRAVEEITGYRVAAYESQILFEPTYVVEIFVLEGPAREDGDAEDDAVRGSG